MGKEWSSRPVLVGVESPDVVQQLARTAGDLALLGAGTVRLVTVTVKPHDSPFGVFADETVIGEYAAESRALLDRVTTPTGVAVDRVGREADGVDSVLLPVASGPHVGAAARMAKAIAARNDASVLVFSVAAGVPGGDPATELVVEGRDSLVHAPGPEVTVETAIEESPDVADAIVEEASAHDVVVMGATRRGIVGRKLAGSVPQRVVERTDRTVILARDGEVVSGTLRRLRGSLRR